MDDYWVWGGRPIKDENGVFHLFAARWPKKHNMHPGWLFHSEIVRAESKTLEGPYEFKEVVFEKRDRQYFDAMSTHNPTIHHHDGKYYLYYIGVNYSKDEELEVLNRDPEHGDPIYREVWCRKRAAVAVANSPYGPWQRPDEPLLEPRPNEWDETVISNPALCILESGETYLIYKSTDMSNPGGGPFFLGGAKAPSPTGPFERVSNDPLFRWPKEENKHVEDPFIWHDGKHFHAVMKDMTGALCGEAQAGVHASSEDFLHWKMDENKVAYSRQVKTDDGQILTMGHLERPQCYFEDGKLTHIFFGTADGANGFEHAHSTWNMPVSFCPVNSNG
jgi:hypothetical protein